MQKELNIKKLILLIMLISLIWAGGYYEYTSAILGGFVMVCFVYAFVKVKGDKKRSSKVELNSGIIFSEMLTLFYGVSIFYATYSALAQAACQEGKIDKVAEYEKKAIERNKFDKEQYVEYLYLQIRFALFINSLYSFGNCICPSFVKSASGNKSCIKILN